MKSISRENILIKYHLTEDELQYFASFSSLFLVKRPEFINSFYDWMVNDTRYVYYFKDVTMFLAVQDKQKLHWGEFFKSKITDEYLLKVKHIGNRHANISLGLDAYTSAMSVSQEWWVMFIINCEQINQQDKFRVINIFNKLILLELSIVSIAYHEELKELKTTESSLRNYAYQDSLTGVLNRHAFFEKLDQLSKDIISSQEKLIILFLDINDFKQINDTYGHDAGDLVLKETAKRLSNTLRKVDLISRFGGDEFVVALSNVKSTEIVDLLVKKVTNALEADYHVNDVTLKVTTSCGVSIFPDDSLDINTLLVKADAKMYQNKSQQKEEV